MKSSDFETFWQVYPRRLNKAMAFKAYNKALKVTDAETIISAATAYAQHVEGTESKFICHASSWLNQHRFLDDLATERNADSPASRTGMAISAAHKVFEKKKAQMGFTDGDMDNDF